MTIFQSESNFCYYDMTPKHGTLANTIGKYPPSVIIVEAPDYVQEGWGYDPNQEGDDRFVEPIHPEGWLYDRDTGTYYKEGEAKPVPEPTLGERIAALEDRNAELTEALELLLSGVTDE